MKSDSLLKHIVTAFVIAMTLYALAYFGIENRRTRKGPWQVAFIKDVSGAPMLLINQSALGITNVQIAFTGTSLPVNFAPSTPPFNQPIPVPYDLPFARCIFMDTTFLPGTIVFDMFGHEIQLIPRVLTIDKQERPWRSNETISLAASTNSPLNRTNRSP